MKAIRIVLMMLAAAMFAGTASAVPPGMKLEFTKSPMGKVTFDGTKHASKGLACNNCHTEIFQMKKGTAEIKMADHTGGKFCFTCHNGEKSFKAQDNCNRCHIKE